MKRLLYNIYYNNCKAYTSVDTLPIYNFIKVLETQNLAYLLKFTTNKEPKIVLNSEKLKGIWEFIISEDFDKNGIDEKAKEIIKKKKQKALILCKYLEKDKEIILNEVNIIEREIQELEKSINTNERINFGFIMAVLSKSYKFQIDQKKISVSDYRNYCKLLDQENKEIEKLNNKYNG